MKKLNVSQLASLGGKARAKKLSKEHLRRIGIKGARARWGGNKKDVLL